MSPPPAPGEGEEDLLEVRCAGCLETLEVERGLTEFLCPDCSTPQALPPELMPPPPRRRRALPIPPAPARHLTAAPHVGLPCGACGALLSVLPGLARCGCPVCGAELAVDAERLRQYLLYTAAAPLVPVSTPPVVQAREGCQEYPDSAVCLGHIQGHPDNQLVHVKRLQVRCRNKQSLSEYPNAGGKEKKRCGRGPTLCLKVWTMPEGERIPVSFNDLGQPIGIEAVTLSSFLGQLARDVTLAPLTYTDWRHFPKKNKNAMWHLVNALGKKWKDWKGILKHERYDVHETDEERLADRDPRVPEEQWKLLVAYWGTEKAKAASARSRNSQRYQPLHRHRTGSKSYARIQEEERQKRPNMEDRYIHTDP